MEIRFKIYYLVGIIFSSSFIYLFGQPQNTIINTITPQFVSNKLNFLASDSLLGRKTPSKELEIAARYIASEFKSYGLAPVNGTYYQPIELRRTRLGENNSLEITKDTNSHHLKLKKDFVPFEFSASETISGELVFAGYGISAKEYNYDDYAQIDVKDKIVVILDHEPGENNSSSVFNGTELSKYGKVQYKIQNAIEHQASGLIILTDPLNHINLKPIGFPWPSLSKLIPNDALPIYLEDNINSHKIPVVHGGESLINIIFSDIDSLINLQKRIGQTLTPQSFDLKQFKVKITTSLEKEKVEAKNVVGYLSGSDPKLKDEVIIIGAHYDHLGYIKNSKTDADSVFNGADDNGSGTSALMCVAKAFTTLKKPPRRSILFIAFTAEEIGIFGSNAYVNNPLFPLDNTVAMLNMDMIGRNHRDTLYLYQAKLYPNISKIIKKQNKKYHTGFTLIEKGHTYGSDHAPFQSKSIPNIFFFSGLHKDYHTVRDNPEYVNYEKIARTAILCFGTAWNIANDNSYYLPHD
jgi:hypothetical protein